MGEQNVKVQLLWKWVYVPGSGSIHMFAYSINTQHLFLVETRETAKDKSVRMPPPR